MSQLNLEHLSKFYGGVRAVEDVTLEVPSGEIFSLVGPSGCGKTTLLRMIAGLEAPSHGKVIIDGVDVTALPAQRRDTVMVFQNYALFPHMNVFQNVAFGLETKRMAGRQIEQRVSETLSLVQLGDKPHSRIQDLSGGEQQRVALARAIAVRPKILLMDEPLSNLDITLRAETRLEIKRLQLATGITTVYVTHDQSEALGLSDRVAVLNKGRVIQTGTPQELYEHPTHPFVATFLGNANVFRAEITECDSGRARLRIDDNVRFSASLQGTHKARDPVIVAVRPEHIRLTPLSGHFDFRARVEAAEYQGMITEYLVRSGETELRVISQNVGSHRPMLHEEVGVQVDAERCFVYPSSEE
jgi:iron(III) transport system ATP-binding protein